MKKLLILYLFTPFILPAQNWQPISADEKFNFQDHSSNYISNTIWVDSTKVIDEDTVFYLNRIVKDCDYCSTIFDNAEGYLLANQPQFLQKSITKKNDGAYVFNGDEEFILYPLLDMGDEWIFDTSTNLLATITDTYEENIFGTLDSVKVITTENQDTFRISKNFGIIDFSRNDERYVLRGIEGRNLGELVPKLLDIYDFEVDDVFQYNLFGGDFNQSFSSIIKRKILSKNLTDSTVTYTMDVLSKELFTNEWGGQETIYRDYEQTFYIDYEEYAYLDEVFNNQLFRIPSSIGSCDDFKPIYQVSELYKDINGRVTKSMRRPSMNEDNGIHGYFFETEDSDILIPDYCFENRFYTHSNGLGEVYKRLEVIDSGRVWELVSYVKDGDTTGIIIPDEDLSVSVNNLQNLDPIIVKPTISSSEFYVNFNSNQILNLDIFNTNGQLVKSYNVKNINQGLRINIEELSDGLYYLRVRTDTQFHTSKIIKI